MPTLPKKQTNFSPSNFKKFKDSFLFLFLEFRTMSFSYNFQKRNEKGWKGIKKLLILLLTLRYGAHRCALHVLIKLKYNIVEHESPPCSKIWKNCVFFNELTTWLKSRFWKFLTRSGFKNCNLHDRHKNLWWTIMLLVHCESSFVAFLWGIAQPM